MTRQLPPGDDPTALHDPDKWIDDADAEPQVPADVHDEGMDEETMAEGEPGDRTGEATSQG
jgi:hypothetical protein